MTAPLFSLVIPTRERAETLACALEACLTQDYDNYEVIVCDNFSSPATRAVVERLASPRIVYHRADRPLSMGENWNLAYSLTRGDYVTYIGDDDALLPHAFSTLNALFGSTAAKAVRWDAAIYSWPNIPRADLANYLHVPLARSRQRLDGRRTMQDVLAGRAPAPLLPNIYHGCVAREILEETRARAGHVFSSYYCDTYSSFATAWFAGEYLSLAAPLSISGFSASSNNIAFNFLRSKHRNTQTLRKENDAAGARLHSIVPDLPAGFVPVADSFLRAKEELFPDAHDIQLDRRAMIERFIAAPPIDAPEEWKDVAAELRRSVSDDPELLTWFDERVKGLAPQPTPRDTYRASKLGVFRDSINIDASRYGVADVAGATRLVMRLLRAGGALPGAAPPGWLARARMKTLLLAMAVFPPNRARR